MEEEKVYFGFQNHENKEKIHMIHMLSTTIRNFFHLSVTSFTGKMLHHIPIFFAHLSLYIIYMFFFINVIIF